MSWIRNAACIVGLSFWIFSDSILAADAPLSAADAAKKVGEKVTVELPVRSGGGNAEYHELYSAKDWKEDGCFFIRFSAAARERFAAVNIPDVSVYFLDETVRVTGEVKLLKFDEAQKPVIYVEQIDQIELVTTRRDFTPTEKYHKRTVVSFTVLFHPDVVERKREMVGILQFLEGQLKALNTSLPKDKLKLLHKVRIWVEWEALKNGAAEFHPSAVWLKRNGYNPEKAGCIEISNVRNCMKWDRIKNTSAMLHEMSHALHNLHLGGNHAGIRAAYQQAMERKLYDSVPFVEGGQRRAYAATNEHEYFAEITEAYFGHNDFFPYLRDQLKKHDPAGFELLKEVWLKPVP